jgi:hypothetical protein
MNMDQFELDAAFEQTYYVPMTKQIQARYAWQSDGARRILGEPPKGGLRSDRAREAQYSLHEKAERADLRVHPRRRLAGGEGKERPNCSSMPGRIISPSISSR